ncbi:methyltransferase domain-containing protein [Saccharopolyspora sp. K220]|uniref:class I SAM-dependent methyltransferase n=1 Tax=Saccharopolyspora soli TaxID=2926618 RepID=UPI001F57E19E|nr:class I SAM-dependent methyltransferase [Saccharopolyspora soli]MCI2423360.1 methyltransferase domain-containing protein [Saccharopolyspora soli]
MSVEEVFWKLHDRLPRQGPGSDATTRWLLGAVGELPERPRVLDIGCGPGRASLLLAREAGAEVTAADTHAQFLDELAEAARAAGVARRITTTTSSMEDLPFADRSFDLVWAEGSVYLMGFDRALRAWKRLLAPGATLVVTECEWTTPAPAEVARAFWAQKYPAMRTTGQNVQSAMELGYTVAATWLLPESDWWAEYYDVLTERVAALDSSDPAASEAIEMTRAEIEMRRDHSSDYGYTGYVLRPR